MKKEIHVTEFGDFDSCRRRWKWGYIEGWETDEPSVHQWLGSGIHKAKEEYYNNDRQLDAMVSAYDNWFDHFWEVESREIPEMIWHGLEGEFKDFAVLGRKMLENFHEYQADVLALQGDIVGTEARLKCPITSPAGEESPFVLTGKLDLVLFREPDYFIIDHKSYTRAASEKGVEVDDQLTGYPYLFWKHTDVMPAGVALNVLLKRTPEPPKLIRKDTALSKDRSQPTTQSLYLAAIEENEFDIADYEEFLQYLGTKGWEDYFQLIETTRNEEELRAYEHRCYFKAMDMFKAAYDDNYAYPSPSSWNCGYCPFQATCKSKDDGGDYRLQLESLFRRADPEEGVDNGETD